MQEHQLRRYARHTIMPEIGKVGQQQLLDARVAVIGAGGLGASALSYLAVCGVGTIGVIDDDVVELSNLNRQIIHETGDIGRPKVQSAQDRLSELNPETQVNAIQTRLDMDNATSLLESYDVIVDGCDNFDARYIINHACRALNIPWVYSAVRGFDAQLSVFDPRIPDAPCYQCLVPKAPPNRNDCAERGVIGALVGVMGSMLALEAIKLLLGIGCNLTGTLLRYDALGSKWHRLQLLRDKACHECS